MCLASDRAGGPPGLMTNCLGRSWARGSFPYSKISPATVIALKLSALAEGRGVCGSLCTRLPRNLKDAVAYLGAMSLPCCIKLPQLCQKQLCSVNSFSNSSGSSTQGCGFSHSKGDSLRERIVVNKGEEKQRAMLQVAKLQRKVYGL